MNVFKSEAFWTAVATLVLNVATFAVANYIPDPKMIELGKVVLVGVDSVAGILIAGFTVKD